LGAAVVTSRQLTQLRVPHAWYGVVVFEEIRWTEDSETHIARHNITPYEVEQALYNRLRLAVPGRENTTEVLGTTTAGRHLLIVTTEAADGRDYIITGPRHEPHRETHVPREGTLTMDQPKIDELRHHYDTTDVAEHFTDATLDTRTTDDVLVSTSIRLPQSLVNQVREQADALGVPATTLMRQWVIEKASTPQSPAVVTVADLQRFIAEQAHPIAS